MNREADFAQLLIQIGTERGLDIQQIMSELSAATFPSFVDAGAVRESLLHTVESMWRIDLEDRINQLRTQFKVSQVYTDPQSTEPQASQSVALDTGSERQPEPAVSSATDLQSDANLDGMSTEIPTGAPVKQDPDGVIPRDATVIWNTRGG